MTARRPSAQINAFCEGQSDKATARRSFKTTARRRDEERRQGRSPQRQMSALLRVKRYKEIEVLLEFV